MLGDDGLLVPVLCDAASLDWRGRLNDVRELLNEDLRFERLSSFFTPFGRLSCGEAVFAADAGDVGVRKLSARSLLDSSAFLSTFSLFASEVVRLRLGVLSGVAGCEGCEVNGPPPGVGGSVYFG